MMALLILAACDQAERAIGSAVGPRKAIAELKYAGDRPDVPPLEERGNAQFTDAAYDDTGTLLITQAWFGSARMQVWNAADGTLISGFDGIIPNPGSKNIWMIDSARRRLFARNGKSDGFALFDLMTGKTISVIDDTDDGAGGKVRRHRSRSTTVPRGPGERQHAGRHLQAGRDRVMGRRSAAAGQTRPVAVQRAALRAGCRRRHAGQRVYRQAPVGMVAGSAHAGRRVYGGADAGAHAGPADRRGHAGGRTPHPSQHRATPLSHGFCVLAGPPLARDRRQRGILALRPHHEGVGQAHRRRAAPQQRPGADAVHRRQLAPDRARRSAAGLGVRRAHGNAGGPAPAGIRKLGRRDQDRRGRQPHPASTSS